MLIGILIIQQRKMELEEFIAGADGYGAALLKELGFIRHFIGALFQDIIAGKGHRG